MTKKPQPWETQIIGSWVEGNEGIEGDDSCERIDLLVKSHLEQVGFGQYGAWETLFRDPEDGRYWERVYPQGEMHGGGPPALINLSEQRAREKYADLF